MEILLGIFIGYLLFKKDNNSDWHQGVVYCKPPAYPRPKRTGGDS